MSGFVYVWRDRKNKMFYVGCHWGLESDGYVCSSERMRSAYRRRPQDFKRRIVARINSDRQQLLAEEHKWLSLIKQEELGSRYYNLNKHHFGHWTTRPDARTIGQKISDANRGKLKGVSTHEWTDESRAKLSKSKTGLKLGARPDSVKEKISTKQRGRVFSEEHKQRLREAWSRRKAL